MRVEQWESKLHSFFESYRGKPFIRGELDCGLFVADCINLLQERDIDAGIKYRGKYKNKKELKSLMQENGHSDLIDITTEALGAPYVNVKMAQRGDCVGFTGREGIAIGIVDLTGRNAITTGKEGFVSLPMKDWEIGWKI
jgi:hypothetical protein